MRKARAILEELFTSGVRVRALRRLLLNSLQEYRFTEIAKLESIPFGALDRELRKIKRLGLAKAARGRGGHRVWSANPRQLLYRELKALLLKAAVLRRAMERPAMRVLLEKIRFAFVFGSMAAGSEDAESDLDLIVIGGISDMELTQLFEDVSEESGHELNSINYSVGEWVRKAKQREGFVQRVIDGPKIFLVGDEDGLCKLVEAPAQAPPAGQARGTEQRNRGSVRRRGSKH